MPRSLLLIDDDDGLRQLVSRRLARQGYTVHCAENGRIGLRVFEAEHPELVITDILMPEMEGIETIVCLKATIAPPKIIAMSGGGRFVGRDFLKWAIHLGADRVLPKPFRMAAMLALISELLGEIDAAKPPAPRWEPIVWTRPPADGDKDGRKLGARHANA